MRSKTLMPSNQQTIRFLWKRWRVLVIGFLLGLAYGIISQQLDFQALHAPTIFIWLDNAVSVALPAVFGILVGLLVDYVHRQTRANRSLSTENAKLQRHLLTQTLSAHILHEIRNPLHNLMAAVEDWRQRLTPEEFSLIERNTTRLRTVTTQLSRWTASDDTIDLQEAVPFEPWINEFILDRVKFRLHDSGITIDQRVAPVVVYMHPLLLGQCFTPVVNNAIEAVVQNAGHRAISLTAQLDAHHPSYVEIAVCNSGCFPDMVLAVQAKEPVESQQGLGLGLVLVRRSLELVGGTIHLANQNGQACTTLRIPGRPA